MSFRISKEFHFSASHQLFGLPPEHQCARLHGHNYVIIVELKSDSLNEVGFVQDYGELKPIKDYIDKELDHRHLNNIFDFNPTAELMAQFLFKKFKAIFPSLVAVTVKETPKTTARYAAED